jgi:hypothetical protein
MNDPERDIHEALDRLVRAGAAPPLHTPAVLAAARRARRRRSLLTGGGAVAGVVAVVGAAAVLRSALPGPGGSTPAAPSPTPATRAPAAGENWQQPPVPGLSPADARRIARGCAESYGGRGGRIGLSTPAPAISVTPAPDVSVTPAPDPSVTPAPDVSVTPGPDISVTPGPDVRVTPGPDVSVSPAPDPSVTPRPYATLVDDPSAPLLADVIRVYNVVRDAAGTVALLYGPSVVLTCEIDGPARPYNAGGGIGDPAMPQWLPGPVSIDSRDSSAGGGPGDKYPDTRGTDLIAGRVIGTATRVKVTYGSATATVPVVNGTYLVRFVRGVGAPIPPGDRGLGVQAYDARGALVGETSGTSLADCYVTPDGTKIGGDRTDPDQTCEPATRWR